METEMEPAFTFGTFNESTVAKKATKKSNKITKPNVQLTDEKKIVYVLMNESLQKYGYWQIKIGITGRLDGRLEELDNTSVPTPFHLAFIFKPFY